VKRQIVYVYKVNFSIYKNMEEGEYKSENATIKAIAPPGVSDALLSAYYEGTHSLHA
jgi:hypothetical protein